MDEFRDAIARITVDGTDVRGTGFLVAPDLAATALHVIADRMTDPPAVLTGTIRLHFSDHTTAAEVVAVNRDADCALLRCLDPQPLSGHPTLPLRELSHEGEAFTTFGYPDTQYVDGMVWVGEVRSSNAQLTNFYTAGHKPYRPVLQLFTAEGAASGAMPKGLSGAPVMVGAAAVGLLRFALMQGSQVSAGTLYACSATDIAALLPERLSLRPPLAPAVILTGEQEKRLSALLVEGFRNDPAFLRRVVAFSLGREAERSATSAVDVGEFVSVLLPILLQQGPGPIGVLLRGVLSARPTDGLRALASEVSPYALEPLTDDPGVQEAHDENLVNQVTVALIELNLVRQQPELQPIIASYWRDFNKTRLQIRILAKYKELHNCLHELQDRLDAMSANISRLIQGDSVQRYLKDDASFLRSLARTARQQLPDLPTAEDEKVWITDLEGCADDLRAASDPAVSVGDSEQAPLVPDRLFRILAKAAGINKELVEAAKHVRLDSLAETMRLVDQHLGSSMQQASLQLFQDGSLAVGRLRARLAGLVAEHDEWQRLNTDLEWARAQKKHQPQAKFASWKQFKTQLIGLCDAFPQEEWSAELKRMMEVKPWNADEPPPEPQIPANIAKLEGQFSDFYNECIDRFIDVDAELNKLCRKVTLFTAPLDALLRT